MLPPSDVFRFYKWVFSSWVRAIIFVIAIILLLLIEPSQRKAIAAENTDPDLIEIWQKINPWSEPVPPPPSQKPFVLPRLYSDETHYNTPTESLKHAPKIDPDTVYLTVMGCFPAKSAFNAELSLVAGYQNTLSVADEDLPSISDHYVGIVGKIPLYSSNERFRQREREFLRRNMTAQQVSGFIAAIASRNQAYRELGLYRALEARSQARVKNGIAETTEQVLMLEKTAESHAKVITFESKVMEYRLSLAGLCQDSKRESINRWLKKLAVL